ncbi:MAG TPA: hypothetical protein VHV82_09850 [Sporichthyaceae bacterium]|jgi:hypothetical protein|nr:hypothetical protein [Sporichthyaceae bacterium]
MALVAESIGDAHPDLIQAVSGGHMALWWVANGVLLLVVAPIVVFLLNMLLIPVIRIRRATEDILAGGVHLMNQVDPVPGLLAITDETVAAVAQGAIRYAGSAAQLLPPKEPTPPSHGAHSNAEAVGTEV